MTIKETTPSPHCSSLSTVTDDDTISPGVVSRVAVEGQQVNPSVPHTVRTQEGQLVVPETPLHSDRTPDYISAEGPVDVPNFCKMYRKGDQTIIRIRWLEQQYGFGMLCCGVCNSGIAPATVFAIFVSTVLWYWWLLLPPIWLGVSLLCPTACICLGSTYITISYDNVKFDQPMKLGSRTTHFKKNGYEEIRVKRTEYTSEDAETGMITTSCKYKLHLCDTRTNSFTQVKSWYEDLNLDVALFVAQEINKYLTSRTGLAASETSLELESV